MAWPPSDHGLSSAPGSRRRRDNVQRTLRKLEARNLVECSGEDVHLVADFAAALDRELEVSEIKRAERLDRDRYQRQQRAFWEAWEAGAVKKGRWRDFYREWEQRNPEPDGYILELERVEVSEPDPVLTNANDLDQFRELVALARRRIAEHRRERPPRTGAERAADLYRRLCLEDRECFDALRYDYRKLAWEVAGRGWTTTIYCGNTTRAALELLELKRVAA